MRKINYLPHIDGLRAVAVLAVIIYHAKLQIFGRQILSGGFIGVDVFFVISGYLITYIILQEIKITGTFSFKNFYQRRVRRILPALFFVMLIATPFGYLFLLPDDMIEFSKHILTSIVFLLNFYLNNTDQGYLNSSSLLKPFLHNWSLSVEEQFYILYPVVIFIVLKYFKNSLKVILGIIFIISIVTAHIASKHFPVSTFYYLHTRIWEMLAGGIVACFLIEKKNNHFYSTPIAFIGLILLCFSLFFYSDNTRHPSFLTLLPTIGTCLILISSNPNQAFTKFLRYKIFIKIGLISYSLYLWHYPVFAFARYTHDLTAVYEKFALIFLIFLLSVLSYFFIERPFRYKLSFNFTLTFLTLILTLLLLFNFTIIYKKGFEEKLPEILKKKNFSNEFRNISQLNSLGKEEKCDSRKNDYCHFFKNNKKTIFLLGDSHVDVLLKFFIQNDHIISNYQIVHMNDNSNPSVKGVNVIQKKTGEIYKKNYAENRIDEINKGQNNIIIYLSRLPFYLNGTTFDNKEGGIEGYSLTDWDNKFEFGLDDFSIKFREQFEEIQKKNKVVLLYPVPEAGWDIPRYFYQIKNIKNKIVPTITTSYTVYKERSATSFKLLNSINGDNIIRIYPDKLLCDTKIKNRCLTNNDKSLFYTDSNHLSDYMAQILFNTILKEIKKIN